MVNGPFVALGKTVHFAPWDQFLDFRFRVTPIFAKKRPTHQKVFPHPTVRALSALTVWIKGNKGLRGEGVEALLLEKNKLVKQSKSFPRGRKSSTHMEDWMNVEELIEKSIKSQDVQGNFTCCMPYGGAGV